MHVWEGRWADDRRGGHGCDGSGRDGRDGGGVGRVALGGQKGIKHFKLFVGGGSLRLLGLAHDEGIQSLGVLVGDIGARIVAASIVASALVIALVVALVVSLVVVVRGVAIVASFAIVEIAIVVTGHFQCFCGKGSGLRHSYVEG